MRHAATASSSTSQALQAIADGNGGNRAAGIPGYDGERRLRRRDPRGRRLECRRIDEFPFTFIGPSELEQLTPVAATYETGTFTDSGSGEVTGNVIPVDIDLVPREGVRTSGCEAADFAGLDFSAANDIALIQRGTCTFGEKARNAQIAGAEAVIIFNQGNTPDARGPDRRHALATVRRCHPGRRREFRARARHSPQAGSTARVDVDRAGGRPRRTSWRNCPARTPATS